ncbi:MAG: hypothetical protein JWO20_3186 [Candidatus Angelobacter sp.]|jgi:hypothetical protein|nr:hypothetical protein [Candidatus Angelobacter sp.]
MKLSCWYSDGMLKNVFPSLKLVAAVLIAVSSASAVGPVRLPHGTDVMIDGKIAAKEWSDAASINVGRNAKLLVKRSKDDVYLAVELPKDRNTSVDLFIADSDGVITDLHSSAKLGERTLSGKSWPEEWVWWNNVDWVANVSRFDSFEPRNFLSANVREFQIRRSRFKGDSWRVMLEVRLLKPNMGGIESAITFPEGASNTDTSKWIELRLK